MLKGIYYVSRTEILRLDSKKFDKGLLDINMPHIIFLERVGINKYKEVITGTPISKVSNKIFNKVSDKSVFIISEQTYIHKYNPKKDCSYVSMYKDIDFEKYKKEFLACIEVAKQGLLIHNELVRSKNIIYNNAVEEGKTLVRKLQDYRKQ